MFRTPVFIVILICVVIYLQQAMMFWLFFPVALLLLFLRTRSKMIKKLKHLFRCKHVNILSKRCFTMFSENVTLKARFLIESLGTETARKWFFPCVYKKVTLNVVLRRKHPATHTTWKLLRHCKKSTQTSARIVITNKVHTKPKLMLP